MKCSERLVVGACLVLLHTLSFLAAPSSAGSFDFEKYLIEADLNLNRHLEEHQNPLDWLVQDALPKFLGSKSSNENGTKGEFKSYAMLDNSNDDAYKLTVLELITRSGFRYEIYDAVADDGYITTLYRIVNPLAERSKLRYPPLIMEHGGTIDVSCYLIASSIQHHPEPWPRLPAHGPFTSWNRSLAFTLSNNGFDVWLAETRGANDKNHRKIRGMAAKTIAHGRNQEKNMTRAENILELINHNSYWSFSQDDIIAHELKSHIDTVLRLTGAKKLHVFTFSLSTPSSLAFLSIRPDYAKKIKGFISMAPIISGDGVAPFIKLILQGICPLLPDTVGTLILTDIVLTGPFRELLVAASYSKILRYSIIKGIIGILFGPSAKFQTLLELNVMGHLLRQLSFKEVKQMCQQMRSNRLQKFDYGPIKNKLLYNSTTPPVYDLGNIGIRDWIIVSGENDELATLQIAERLYQLSNPKPVAHIIAPAYNHLDMIAGFDNDKHVNRPIVNYLIEMSEGYGLAVEEHEHEHEHDYETAASGRSFDVRKLFPEGLRIGEIEKTITNVTTNFSTDELMDTIQKGLIQLIKQFSSNLKLPAAFKDREILFGGSKEDSFKKESYNSTVTETQ